MGDQKKGGTQDSFQVTHYETWVGEWKRTNKGVKIISTSSTEISMIMSYSLLSGLQRNHAFSLQVHCKIISLETV